MSFIWPQMIQISDGLVINPQPLPQLNLPSAFGRLAPKLPKFSHWLLDTWSTSGDKIVPPLRNMLLAHMLAIKIKFGFSSVLVGHTYPGYPSFCILQSKMSFYTSNRSNENKYFITPSRSETNKCWTSLRLYLKPLALVSGKRMSHNLLTYIIHRGSYALTFSYHIKCPIKLLSDHRGTGGSSQKPSA
jgi:hypothetical protein